MPHYMQNKLLNIQSEQKIEEEEEEACRFALKIAGKLPDN